MLRGPADGVDIFRHGTSAGVKKLGPVAPAAVPHYFVAKIGPGALASRRTNFSIETV